MAPDSNSTVALKVATSLNSSLDTYSKIFLVKIYKLFPFLGHSIFNYTYGQILVAILIFLFILFVRPIFVHMIISFALKLAQKTKNRYDDRIIKNLKKPLKFAFLILALYIFISILYLENKFLFLILDSLVVIDFFWLLWVVVDSTQGVIHKSASNLSKKLSNSLSKFILKIIKIIIWVFAIASVLSIWGINVTALIASLGLGGLAFALAAKDTAANLFGSIAILADKSIKIGDWVKVNGVEGIVEDIGMRTTKIRTFYKSLVVVPNQIVANSNIENFSRREHRRILARIGLTYNTTNKQIEQIIKEIKELLLSHPGIDKNETMLVNFDNFGDSAKEIFIYTFTNTAVWQDYLNIKEDIFYKIEEIVNRNGSSFAFPSQSIYVESLPN